MKNQLLDYQRTQFLRLLFEAHLEFREIFQEFDRHGAVPRARVVEQLLQERFQDLRRLAHSLFRGEDSDDQSEWRDHELLLDLIVGACYHEILQLQENLYLVKLYRPRYEDLAAKAKDSSLNEYFEVGRNLIREAENQIPKNLNWIWQLSQEAVRLLTSLIGAYRGNRVLLRFLTQHVQMLEEVYGRGELDGFFRAMYEGGYREALWECARDYIRSAHFPSALDTIGRLVQMEKSGSGGNRIDHAGILEALHRILGQARLNRDLEVVNRCEMMIAQIG